MNATLIKSEGRSFSVKLFDKFGCSGMNRPGLQLVVNNPAIAKPISVPPMPEVSYVKRPDGAKLKTKHPQWAKRAGTQSYVRFMDMVAYLSTHENVTWREVFNNTIYTRADYVFDRARGWVE